MKNISFLPGVFKMILENQRENYLAAAMPLNLPF